MPRRLPIGPVLADHLRKRDNFRAAFQGFDFYLLAKEDEEAGDHGEMLISADEALDSATKEIQRLTKVIEGLEKKIEARNEKAKAEKASK